MFLRLTKRLALVTTFAVAVGLLSTTASATATVPDSSAPTAVAPAGHEIPPECVMSGLTTEEWARWVEDGQVEWVDGGWVSHSLGQDVEGERSFCGDAQIWLGCPPLDFDIRTEIADLEWDKWLRHFESPQYRDAQIADLLSGWRDTRNEAPDAALKPAIATLFDQEFSECLSNLKGLPTGCEVLAVSSGAIEALAYRTGEDVDLGRMDWASIFEAPSFHDDWLDDWQSDNDTDLSAAEMQWAKVSAGCVTNTEPVRLRLLPQAGSTTSLPWLGLAGLGVLAAAGATAAHTSLARSRSRRR